MACVAASKMSSKGGDGAAGFMAVWTCILLIVISVIGTVIMRRYQTALSIGFLIGIIFIMTQQMLILFAVFADQANNSGNTLVETQSQEAMAVFAFFLFLVYAAFGSMLSVFRQDVIKQDVPQNDGMEYEQQGGYEQQGAQDGYHDESQI